MASGKTTSKGKGKSRSKKEITDLSEEETQFEQHSEDDLYDVVEILNEKPNGLYLVRWAGTDPNGKPWDDSWVPRKDITDDLVLEWRRKKSQKDKEKKLKRKQSFAKRSKSRASESSLPSRQESTSTARAGPKHGTPPANGRKRKKSARHEPAEDDLDIIETRSSPRKRQKLSPRVEIQFNAIQSKGSSSPDRRTHRSPPPPETGQEEEPRDEVEEEELPAPFAEEFEPLPELLRERTWSPEPMASSSKLPLMERQETLSPSKWMSRNLKGSMKRRSSSSLRRISSQVESREDAKATEKPSALSSGQRSRSGSSKVLPVHLSSNEKQGAPNGRSRSASLHNARHTSHDAEVEVDDLYVDDDEAYNAMAELPFSQADENAPLNKSVTIIPETQPQLSGSLDSVQAPDSTPQITSSLEAQDGSHDLSANADKPLKSIPVVTPSKFKPHLPAVKSISQLIPTLQKDGGPFSSSIETQSTQQKRVGANHQEADEEQGTATDEDVDEIEESSSLPLRERGLQLAEIHRQQRLEITQIGTRRSLDVVLSGRRSLSVTAPSNLRTSIPPEPILQDEDALVQHMEDQFMDLDWRAGASLQSNLTNGVPLVSNGISSQRPRSSQVVEVLEEEQFDPSDEENEDDIKSVAKSLSLGEEDLPEDDPFLARDHHEISRPETPTTTTSAQDHYVLPRTPRRFEILGSPHKYSADVVKTPTLQLNSALGLLHQKSEEIADLKMRISDGEDERRALLDRIALLEAESKVLQREQLSSSEPATESSAAEAAALQASMDELRETYESSVKERDGLVVEIDLLKISRDDAEKNASIFKDLYSKASSFTDELREENANLRSRLTLAETQVSKGIQQIRALYSAHAKKMSTELERSQLLLRVLQEKDRRTDDDVRRKAAREPELLAKIEELRADYQEKKGDLATVLRQRDDLLVEKQHLNDQIEAARSERLGLRTELRRLQVELARFSARERSIKKMIDLPNSLDQDADTEDEDDDPSEEEVFVCSWAIDDGAERCGETFSNRQDLQDHLFLVGHL